MSENDPSVQKALFKSFILSEEDKLLYRKLLEYIQTTNSEYVEIVAFILSDGTIKFSSSEMMDVFIKISTEAIFSDRLWVIVSVAYLEDQMRQVLAKFFANEEISRELLDPNQSLVASLIPMANLAFSLGLIAKSWHNALKKMAQLRNKFAHIPSANSFDELIKIDPKTNGLMQSIKERYVQITGEKIDPSEEFKEAYKDLFRTLFYLMQFSLEHLAVMQQRQVFGNDLIRSLRTFSGFDSETLSKLID